LPVRVTREGALRGVVEALRAHRGDVGQPGVHLVGHRECGEELGARGVDALRGRENRTQVVGGMVGLSLGQVRIHEVEVAAQRTVEERCAFGARPAAADERRRRRAAEILEQAPDRDDRLRIERTDRDAESVEHADLELFERLGAQLLPARLRDETGEIL
jgi:hypothetical protein